jgi:hypothetical protein
MKLPIAVERRISSHDGSAPSEVGSQLKATLEVEAGGAGESNPNSTRVAGNAK